MQFYGRTKHAWYWCWTEFVNFKLTSYMYDCINFLFYTLKYILFLWVGLIGMCHVTWPSRWIPSWHSSYSNPWVDRDFVQDHDIHLYSVHGVDHDYHLHSMGWSFIYSYPFVFCGVDHEFMTFFYSSSSYSMGGSWHHALEESAGC